MRFIFYLLAGVFLWQTSFAAEPVLRLQKTVDPVKTKVLARPAPAPVLKTDFKPLTTVRINPERVKIKNIRPLTPGTAVKPAGPDPAASLDLSDIIEEPALIADLGDACGFDPHLIFQDRKATNVFYYLPRSIMLTHDPDGYGLSVQYNHQAEPGQPSVMLTAVLAAPFRAGDTVLLKAILRQALGLTPSDRLELKALSGIGAAASMDSLTAGLALPPERIHLLPPTHLRQSFRLTLSLTQDEAEEVLAQIGREGIAGSLNVPVGEAVAPVPILIRYARFSGDPVKGFEPWAAGRPVEQIVNITEFPLRLHSINAYRMRGHRLERIAKNLKQSDAIAPGGAKPFNLPSVTQVLGEDLLVTWLETDLETDCDPCLQTVDSEVRKGVALAPRETLKIEAIPMVFSEFGLYKIIVTVQSPYFTSEGDKLAEREVELSAAANTSSDLLLYVPAGKGSDPLLYRYKLILVSETGESFQDAQWRDGQSLSQYIGSAQVEPLLAKEP
jgi:hypothetical protein